MCSAVVLNHMLSRTPAFIYIYIYIYVCFFWLESRMVKSSRQSYSTDIEADIDQST